MSEPAPPPLEFPTAQVQALEEQEQRSLLIFRAVGWGLLLLYLVDLVQMLLPPQVGNPVWEFGKASELVQIAPVPLLALMLVFQGGIQYRGLPERRLLRLMSRSLLGVAIAYLLLFPLAISAAVRINSQNQAQLTAEFAQKQASLSASAGRLEKLPSGEVAALQDQARRSRPQAPDLEPEAFRSQLRRYIDEARSQARRDADAKLASLQRNLLKSSVKVVLQAVICAVIFLYVWSMTHWARRSGSFGYEVQPATLDNPLLLRLRQLFGYRARRRR